MLNPKTGVANTQVGFDSSIKAETYQLAILIKALNGN